MLDGPHCAAMQARHRVRIGRNLEHTWRSKRHPIDWPYNVIEQNLLLHQCRRLLHGWQLLAIAAAQASDTGAPHFKSLSLLAAQTDFSEAAN